MEQGQQLFIIEENPFTKDLIRCQSLGKMGFKLKLTGGAGSDIQPGNNFSPNVLPAYLDPPGLNAQDLIAKLSFYQSNLLGKMTAAEGQKDTAQG